MSRLLKVKSTLIAIGGGVGLLQRAFATSGVFIVICCKLVWKILNLLCTIHDENIRIIKILVCDEVRNTYI